MRDLITGLAVLLLLALTAALAGPHVVDWGARRDEIGRQLSAALGQQVTVDGPISLTLLPTPSLKLGHVTLGEGGVLSGSVARIKASAAVPPLLRGELRLTNAVLQGGRLTLDPAGRNPLGAAGGGPFVIAVEKLAVSDTEIALRSDGGPRLAASDVNGTIEATALGGPFRGTLGFTFGDVRRTLRFSTGQALASSMRLRATTENVQAAMRAEYDGVISWATGGLALDGKLSASGNTEVALPVGERNMLWRGEARIKGVAAAATADQVEIAFGHSERQAVLSGVADISLTGGPKIVATLAARQIDVDRLMAGEDNARPPTPDALLRHLVLAGGSGPPLPVSLRADVTVGSMLLGGGVIAAPRLVVTADAGGWLVQEAEGEFPGRARLTLRQRTAGAGPLSAEVKDLPAFAAWMQGAPARPGLVRSLAVEGDFMRTSQGFDIANAIIRADDMRFAGRFGADFQAARPRLKADLVADQLDILKLPDLGDSGAEVAFDMDLALDARRVRYNGVGAGSIRTVLSRTGPELTIGELTVRDLGGASMTASGSLGGASPRIAADIQAEKLDALLELLDRLLPHSILPHLKARARALAPARVLLTADPAADGGWRLALKGGIGGTDVAGSVTLDRQGALAAGEGLKLDLAAAALAPLARQLGLPAIDAPGAGPLRLSLSAVGLGAKPTAPWSLKGTIGGSAIDVSGDIKADPSEAFAGRLVLSGGDISPLAQTLLVTVPRVQPGLGLRVESGVDLRGYRITLRDMKAVVGSVPITGEVAFDLLQFGRVAGQLRMPYFDAGAVTPLVFGEPAERAEGWSSAAFPAASGVSLPGDLWIAADEVRLGDGLRMETSSFVLRFDNGLLYLEHGAGRMRGLDLTAQGTLRRTGRSVSLAGKIGFKGGLPGAEGSGEGEIDFTSLGDSPAQLVATLSGGGSVKHRGVTLPALARSTFGDIAGAKEQAAVPGRAALVDRLKAAVTERLPLPAGEARLTLAGGALSVGPLAVSDGANAISASLAYNLRSFTVGGRMAYVAAAQPKGWTGPPPQAVLTWRGPLARPQLGVEADEFANGLTALAIQRETERIEILEQDQRERSFFNRRLRAAEEERKAEEDRRRAEALARQQAERDRLERQKAEEALRNAPLAPPPLSIMPPLVR